jgi:hypothetical protein
VAAPIPTSRRKIAWLALALVLLHNSEEALAFRDSLPRIPALLPEPLSRIAAALSYPTMLLALAVVSVVAAIVAVAVVLRPGSPRASWALLVLEAVMGMNAIAHLASAVFVFGGYAPGLVTAVLLNAPFAIWCFRRARRERWVGTTALMATVPVALVLHGPVLVAGLWLAGRAAH